MDLLAWETAVKWMVTGAVLLAAVVVDDRTAAATGPGRV
jgi:ABC-type xylose transport system permease subunit